MKRKDRRSKGILDQVRDLMESGSVKIAISVAGVLVVIFGVLFDGRIHDNEVTLDQQHDQMIVLSGEMSELRQDVDVISSNIAAAARRLGRISVLIDDLSDIRRELIEAIRKR